MAGHSSLRLSAVQAGPRILPEAKRKILAARKYGESELRSLQKQKGLDPRTEAFEINPGGDLRSHTVTRAVSSALRGLTSVFGMGTGVTPAVWPPGKL